MKLIFNIHYRTNWGESVYLTGNINALGAHDLSRAIPLCHEGDGKWSCEIEVDDNTGDFTYNYLIKNDNGAIIAEWGHGNKFISSHSKTVRIYDSWQNRPYDHPLYSSAFTCCINRHNTPANPVKPVNGFITISVCAPMVCSDDVLVLCGEGERLGDWSPVHAPRMNSADFPVWKVNIPSSGIGADTQYKFVIIKASTGEIVSWEDGDNRRIGVAPSVSEATVIQGLRFFNNQLRWKGAGTAVPVFSLRSEADFGVGDFYDLIPLVDWAVSTGQKFIQVLPVNDTTMTRTWIDSYPYNAISTFALHPMYLRLEAVGVLENPERREYYRQLSRELNQLTKIDYERVTRGKEEYMREIFAQDGAKTIAGDDFKAFVARNSSWLKPYAAFCALRDRYNTSDFNDWGEYSVYSPEVLARVEQEAAQEMNFVYFVQYHLDKQMAYAHNYARAHGIALKGDIPIGISRASADAWQSPRLFNMDCQAGAPPDDFSVNGQNWGFPTYNWQEMSLDGFAWWKSRFAKMAEYFDAYRIDHVLGFFRIWQIPMDAIHGLLGYFNPALPFTSDELRYSYDFWLDPAEHTRPYITDDMLGEMFGEYAQEVRTHYLDYTGDNRYRLKNDFNTQRKVVDFFSTQPRDEYNTRICNGLMNLIDDVLFIEDPVEKGKYHPRISAQSTDVYRSLNDYERWCFDRLYNDFFYHRHNDFWYEKAMWKLPPLIAATDMLTCAEDLGMIPACVPAVMHRLQILSLELQRMPKEFGADFGNTWNYPYYSICTTSTHDMGGIRQWWEEDRQRTQKYYNEILHESGEAPFYAEPWICDRIIDLNLQSPSMLCILPLQDWLSIDGNIRRHDPREEQINVPANPRHYWCYRMHLTIEQLQANMNFNLYLRDKIKTLGR